MELGFEAQCLPALYGQDGAGPEMSSSVMAPFFHNDCKRVKTL